MKKFAIIGLLIIAALTSCSNNETADNSFRAEQYRDELRMHDSQVEWWYFFAFAEGKTTGREYGIMASFFTFRGGENSPVGHYAIHEVTDLQTGAHYATSRADSAFLTTMGNVEEMIYQFLLQRRPSPIEQMRIDSLKNARAPWPHSRISSITTTEWPVYLDYAGDYFRVNSPELSFDCRAAADDYSFDINLNPVADIVPVMGTGMVSDVMHYYTFPDLALSGRVEFEGAVEDIEGRAWFDHQWQDFGGDPAEIANGWRWAGVQAGDVYIHLYQFHNIFTKELTGSGMMTISRNGAEDIL
ncbi:MAG: lipocalin-like domain-containing protein, partial [Bacteroidota bacterium]